MAKDDSYDWLYAKDAAAAAQGAPEALPPPALPPAGSTPKPRRRRRWPRLLLLVVIVWLVFLVVVPLWAWSSISRVDAEPDGDRPAEQAGTNYLIVGSDSRRGLTPEQRLEFGTGNDSGSSRTDTIMLMHVGSGPTLLMSIPRDSRVDVPGYGTERINAAYAYGGAELLVQTIEENTGIRIDNYVEIGFGGLVNLVDAVGGIQICPKEQINDPDAALSIAAGCQWVDGKTALGYSRSRHTYDTQDIQRVQAQREVIGSIAGEVKSPLTFLNPWRYWRTVTGGASSVQVGDNVGLFSMARFAISMSGAMSDKGLNCTVPLRDFTVRWDSDRADEMFSHVINDTTDEIGDLCTKDGLPK